MATAKPRVTVTLEPDTYATLRRLSRVNGESMSAILSGLADVVSPALARVADLVEAAQGAQEDVLEGLRGSLEESNERLAPLLAEGQAEFVAAMERAAGVTGADPRPVITGVRSEQVNDIHAQKGSEQ